MKNYTATFLLRGLFAFILFVVAGHASAVAMLSFDAPDEAVVGSTIDVDIRVSALDAADDVGSYIIDISFDPAVLGFVGYVLGSELEDPDPSVGPFDLSFGEGPVGVVNVAEAASFFRDLSLQPDAFTLVTLTFDVLAKGISMLSFDAFEIGDGIGAGLLDVNATDSSIRAVPLPGALLLMAIGLLAMQRARSA